MILGPKYMNEISEVIEHQKNSLQQEYITTTYRPGELKQHVHVDTFLP